MSYIFTLASDGKVILDKNCMKLVPSMKYLSEDELLFVILAVDYHSPYNKFPDEERYRKAKNHVYGTMQVEPWEEGRIKTAMHDYMSLQYDRRRELKKVLEKKLDLLQGALLMEEVATKITNTLTSIKELRKNIADLEKEILTGVSEYQSILEGKGNRSLIEIMQYSRNAFENLQKPQQPWQPQGQ